MEYNFTIKASSVDEAIKILKSGNFDGNNFKLNVPSVMKSNETRDKSLVEKINYCYIYNNSLFMTILKTLAKRDERECKLEGVSVDMECADDIYIYLNDIADVNDLETIIKFVKPIDITNGDLMY